MKRSKHSLSHYRLTSLNMGVIYPVGCVEVLPGDSFRHRSAVLLRVAPLVSPVMHPVHVAIHHWFCPSRILWVNWESFITQSQSGLTLPTISFANTDTAFKLFINSLGVGVTTVPGTTTIQALPLRMYNQVFNEFYRDQDLTTAAPERTGDTGDLVADYVLRAPSWEKDYFTTARAAPQQGANTEVVSISFNQPQVPVKGIGIAGTGVFNEPNKQVRESGGGTPTYANAMDLKHASPDDWHALGTAATGGFPNIYADLTGVSAGTMDINAWRRAMALQRFREHRNRYGSRYRDLLAYLGINSSDARLQRPEYLGGGKQTVAFSEVLATSDPAGGSKIGTMAGHGISAMASRPYNRFFEEHGYVMSVLVVRPVSVYQNAVPRTYLRRTYSDFWQKELEIQGEQAITNFEVYGDTATPAGVFGYNNRYDEYRHHESFVSGEFRNTLNYWHMARIFGSQPVLNQSFVTSDPTTRIYASSATDQLYAMVSHQIAARRLVSKFPRT